MERPDARRPRCVTPPAPRELTDEAPRWQSVWSLPAEARLLDRNLDVSRPPSRWRPLWVAAWSALLPSLLTLAGGIVLFGIKGGLVAVTFTAPVAALTGLVLDRRLVFWNDVLSTTFVGVSKGALLGVLFGCCWPSAVLLAIEFLSLLRHHSKHGSFNLIAGAFVGGGVAGFFVGALTGMVASFFAWLKTADPVE
jgi:hypothetical protein